ncbi:MULTISPECIES: hypothetical protein [Weeksellaceae]|uniref:hypothetical protein n=1 Tax=Weeksellaceae TaxID=2762318 RepID=UPI002FC5C399
MKTKLKKIILLILMLNMCLLYSQNFGKFSNIENFFNLTKQEVENEIKINGYQFKEKDKSGIATYIKRVSGYTFAVNLLFGGTQLKMIGWDDRIIGGKFIVDDIGNDSMFKIDESVTDDYLGIFGLKSIEKDLQISIFKTRYNLQKGMMSFTVRRIGNKKIKVQKNITSKIVEESKIKKGFNIPTESYTEENNKPKIYDNNLEYILLQSPTVLWKKPNVKSSVDKSDWKLELTSDTFIMKSLNFERIFKVKNVKYDDDFQMQKFELVDENNIYNFNLFVSYIETTENYRVLVQSTDYKEEYQFQTVKSKKKVFLNSTLSDNFTYNKLIDKSYYEDGDTFSDVFKKYYFLYGEIKKVINNDGDSDYKIHITKTSKEFDNLHSDMDSFVNKDIIVNVEPNDLYNKNGNIKDGWEGRYDLSFKDYKELKDLLVEGRKIKFSYVEGGGGSLGTATEGMFFFNYIEKID